MQSDGNPQKCWDIVHLLDELGGLIPLSVVGQLKQGTPPLHQGLQQTAGPRFSGPDVEA